MPYLESHGMNDGRKSALGFFLRMGLHLKSHEVGQNRGTDLQQLNLVLMLHLPEKLRRKRARRASRGHESCCSCWANAIIAQPKRSGDWEFAIP